MYYSEMTRLVSDYPSVHKHLSEGGFSVQMGINPFGKLPVDQTLEETVNKDTQCPGGTKGFSLNAGATAKYYLTAEYRSAALGPLRSLINNNNTRIRHADLDEARIKRDEEDVTSICGILEMQWTNPMSRDPSDLSTGKAPPNDRVKDLLGALVKGETAYRQFETERMLPGHTKAFHDPIHRLKLQTLVV